MRTLVMALSLAFLTPLPAGADAPAFAVHKVGRGRPLILLPGLLSSGEVWTAPSIATKIATNCTS